MAAITWPRILSPFRAIYPRRAKRRWLRFSRGRGLAVVRWQRVSPWARGDARQALSMLVGAAGAPMMLFVLALPFGGLDLVGRAMAALLPADDRWVEVVTGPVDRLLGRGAAVVTAPKPDAHDAAAAAPGSHGAAPGSHVAAPGDHGATATGPGAHGAAAVVPPPPTATPKAPVVTAARPMSPTRFVSQLEGRLHVPLAAEGLEAWRHRTADGFATVRLELRPEGGCDVALTADLTRQVEAGPGYRVLDAFIAAYMPDAAGPTAATRLAWWRTTLDERRADAERRGQMELGTVWNPTFNVGRRVAKAELEGEAFTLSFYVPPEDPGL